MKRSRLFALIVLLASVAAVVGLAVRNFVSVRSSTCSAHERWVQKVSDVIVADRLADSHWLKELHGLESSDLPRALLSHPELAGAFWFDVRTHEFERIVRQSYSHDLAVPDPRVVLTQLKAAQTQSTQLGPVLVISKGLFSVVAEPLDQEHVLVAILEAPWIAKFLEEQSQDVHLQSFVFDTDHRRIFTGGDVMAIESSIAPALARAESGEKSGTVSLARKQAWQWVATFHLVPKLDWIVIVAEPAPWAYVPSFLFLASLICVFWLAGFPLRAAQALRRAREEDNLRQFAVRVDNFVHGKDLILNEPPYPFQRADADRPGGAVAHAPVEKSGGVSPESWDWSASSCRS